MARHIPFHRRKSEAMACERYECSTSQRAQPRDTQQFDVGPLFGPGGLSVNKITARAQYCRDEQLSAIGETGPLGF